MTTNVLDGLCLTPEGWRPARLRFGRRIEAIEPIANAAANDLVLPGFVDLHVHGGGGGDVMAGEAGVRLLAAAHARHGTTSLLPTTLTAPPDEIEVALAGIGAVMAAPAAGEARVLGAHLEGPFIAEAMLGAQPPFARDGDAELLARLLAAGPVRIATIAPEIAGGPELAARILAAGVALQLGHSACTHDVARPLLEAGAGLTHLFNAMSGIDHHEPGLACAAFAHALHAELIADLVHVRPGAMLAALRAIPGAYAVTDATAAAGMPDGRYRLGRHEVVKLGDAVRLEDGTLAGSTLTMDEALRRLVGLGLDLADAVGRIATRPADRLGLIERGRIAPGAFADLVVCDRGLRLRRIWIEGRAIEPAQSAAEAPAVSDVRLSAMADDAAWPDPIR